MLGGEGSLDIVLHSNRARNSVVVQQPRPFNTLVCSAVVEPDNESSKDWVYLIYPKASEPLVGGELPAHKEYEGMLAQIVKRKDIRVFEGTQLSSQVI